MRKFLLIFAIFILTFNFCDLKFHHRLTKVECNTSEKSISKLFCYLRAYDRRKPVGNFGFVLHRKITDGLFLLSRYHRTKNDEPYTQDLFMERIEVCKLFLGATNTIFLKQVLEWAMKISKDLTKLCNYSGELKFYNLTIPATALMMILPSGSHRTTLTFYDHEDENIFNITYWAIITK
ncbi:hypothetical protein PVAND_016466 [Polypedilum vanderplanki]|uniref:Secreted protein n=1 Tax=Polypedilum vanderplanki TaxID=319348 RepID=A0A9J6BFZ9_POLVA|nr:hypothetical protein PVAND_016466 [Polypedilum vanderplanki]